MSFCSVTTLGEWRDANKRPPGWIEDAGIRYPLGEVRRYAREQLERLALADSGSVGHSFRLTLVSRAGGDR